MRKKISKLKIIDYRDRFMEVVELPLQGLKVIYPRLYIDERGYFFEGYHEARYRAAGIDVGFVQDNVSLSKRGVVRGLHMQAGQAKLVSVSAGAIWDVAVDLREDSKTFRQWFGVELNADSGVQLFIPAGFAHGFCALTDGARLHYKVSCHYDPAAERVIRWDDPALGIQWPVELPILSGRDAGAPCL